MLDVYFSAHMQISVENIYTRTVLTKLQIKILWNAYNTFWKIQILNLIRNIAKYYLETKENLIKNQIAMKLKNLFPK